MAVSANSQFNSVQEFIDYAKARPGEVSFGTPGVGSVFTFTLPTSDELAGSGR